jgi:hypothetical protein
MVSEPKVIWAWLSSVELNGIYVKYYDETLSIKLFNMEADDGGRPLL